MKKKITIYLTIDTYELLNDLIGLTMNLNGHKFSISSKSEAIEKILDALMFDERRILRNAKKNEAI